MALKGMEGKLLTAHRGLVHQSTLGHGDDGHAVTVGKVAGGSGSERDGRGLGVDDEPAVLVDVALAPRAADPDGPLAHGGKHGIAGRVIEDPRHAGVFLLELGDYGASVGVV